MFVQILVAVLLCGALAGHIAPLLPEEYAVNTIQYKWNENGFLVNNTYSGLFFEMLFEPLKQR